MRKAVALIAGLLILLLVNQGIYGRERLLTNGRIVLLELSPVDPRSLMQGDYMRLNFDVADRAFPAGQTQLADGHLVVAVDRRGVGQFRRRANAGPLAPDEIALRYRVRGGQARFATNAFFFEEGQAKAFENARFGEFRVGSDGEMILTGLRGSRLEPLRGAAE
jgi:uncharacterized membrane-anchored protein